MKRATLQLLAARVQEQAGREKRLRKRGGSWEAWVDAVVG